MKSISALMIIMVLLAGCQNEQGFGTYYEFSYTDSLSSDVAGDSIHIMLIQPQTRNPDLGIPFDVTHNEDLVDTVRLIFEVLYGGYSAMPSPVKEDTVLNDTLYVWYANFKSLRGFPKPIPDRTTPEVQTSPRVTYYSVQRVHIRTSSGRLVTFHSKLVSY